MNTARTNLKSLLAPIGIGLLLPITVVNYAGCKKDEPPPPLPSAAPATTPEAPLELEIEDAGPEEAEAEAAAKKTGPYVPAASLKACCQAIQQNAANAPEPTATYMKQAAATCFAAVASGAGSAQISSIARGVGVACK